MIDFVVFLILAYAIYAIRSRMILKRRLEELQRNQRQSRNESNFSGDRNARPGMLKDERYYAGVLGLTGSLTRDEIKKRYHERVAQYHPDKVSRLGPKLVVVAEEEMKEINESYDFFKKQYDIH